MVVLATTLVLALPVSWGADAGATLGCCGQTEGAKTAVVRSWACINRAQLETRS